MDGWVLGMKMGYVFGMPLAVLRGEECWVGPTLAIRSGCQVHSYDNLVLFYSIVLLILYYLWKV